MTVTASVEEAVRLRPVAPTALGLPAAIRAATASTTGSRPFPGEAPGGHVSPAFIDHPATRPPGTGAC